MTSRNNSTTAEHLYVIKRDGTHAPVHFDEISERLKKCAELEPALPEDVDYILVAQKVVSGIFPGVKTSELDNLAAETAAYMSTIHPSYEDLAARISISNLQKETFKTYSESVEFIYNHINPKTKEKDILYCKRAYDIIMENRDLIDSKIKPERDFTYNFFGFKTLLRGYLIKLDGKTIETPQYMLMRVAIGIHMEDLEAAFETYDLLSNKYFTHATPTLFNACSENPQLSSCFLLTMIEDSIEGIYRTLKKIAITSKWAGGVGLSTSIIRASQSHIKGTNGTSNGLTPMLKVFNDTARYVDQGGGKRKGAFAIYLEPWHADVFEFLDLKKNTGKEEQRARDLFYALWICDLFMKRVEADGDWSLFCPNEAKGLADVWGEEFEKLYINYENTPGLARKTIKARELWFAIIDSQIETGTPYILYKDHANRKSNQQNLGTIKSSNLCCEIMEYTSPKEIAVCNLASIALPRFVKDGKFDHDELFRVVKVITKNLNKIIDINYYPTKEAKYSNLRNRPIGIGVQGLADAFILLRLPFDSEGAAQLNKDIFETIYFAALTASNELAYIHKPYETYPGSPVSKGILQFDMWNVTPSNRWDWKTLRETIAKHGVRNSLLVAPMPTASTSQILGNNEAFEPYTSNIYSRRVLAGEFTVINKHLIHDLIDLDLWNPTMKNKIIGEGGSIQNIPEIPTDIKELYKTVWEISQKVLINMSADRGAFVDQSQSFNIFVAEPTYAKLSTIHFMTWKKGLKTGMYYLRTRPAADAIQFTVDKLVQENNNNNNDNNKKRKDPPKDDDDDKQQKKMKFTQSFSDGEVCTMKEGCFSCGS